MTAVYLLLPMWMTLQALPVSRLIRSAHFVALASDMFLFLVLGVVRLTHAS
jgi:hypothetical protein